MSDAFVIALLTDKENHERYSEHIKEYTVSPHTWDILNKLGDYYRSHPKETTVDIDKFTTYYFMVAGKMKMERSIIIRALLDEVKVKQRELTSKTKDDLDHVYVDLVHSYIRKDYATRIMNTVVEMLDESSGKDIEDVQDLCTQYEKEVGVHVDKSDLFVSSELGSLVDSCSSSGFEWRLESLNRSVGPLRDGDFAIFAGRVESGKTTFIASEVSYFATQLKDASRPIVWVNNEERGTKVMMRIITAYFGVPVGTLLDDLATYQQRYKDEVGDKVLLLSDDSGITSVKKLDALFSKVNPSMIIFDQLDKVHGFSYDAKQRDDIRLGNLYAWARTKAKEYGPVIAVSQLDASAENVQWVGMDKLRGSKTDKPGEADLVITMGKLTDKHLEYNRYFNIPKNKLFGGPRSTEDQRHGMFEAMIHPEIARFSCIHDKGEK